MPSSGNNRSGHAYGHVYGGAYEDDYSISQHQARTGSGNRSGLIATSVSTSGGVAGGASTAIVAPSERNGKAPGRFQDPAPRAWGDGSVPRYVASPTHAAAAAATSPSAGTPSIGGTPSAPSAADYERPPPYYYPGPAWVLSRTAVTRLPSFSSWWILNDSRLLIAAISEKLWWSRPRFHQRPEWRLCFSTSISSCCVFFFFLCFVAGLMTKEKRKYWLFSSWFLFLFWRSLLRCIWCARTECLSMCVYNPPRNDRVCEWV